jgi:sigma-B regulation protein RsbU (phosphoserine phosphatase)
MPFSSARPRTLVALALLFVLAAVFQASHSRDSIRILLHKTSLAAFPFALEPAGPAVTRVGDAARQAGMARGDRLVAVAGQPYTGYAVLARAVAAARAGETLPLTVERFRPDGRSEALDLRMVLPPLAERPPDATEWTMALVMGLALSLLCLAVGFFVAAVRPHDPLAWLLLMLLLSFARLADPNLVDIPAWPALLAAPGLLYQDFFRQSWGIWMMAFGIYFPQRLGLDRRLPWLKWVLIAPLALHGTLVVLADLATAFALSAAGPLWRAAAAWGRAPQILNMIAVGTFFASIGYKSGTLTDPDARRRLRLMLWGSQISLSPIFVVVLVALVRDRRPFVDLAPEILVPVLLLLVLFPLTLAYVIVVQRALDLRVVIRQGLQYALTRGGIRVLQFLVVVAVIFTAVNLAANPTVNRPRRIQYIATGVLFVFLARRAGERLLSWTDRRFFREAYDAERILTGLSEQVRTMVETAPLVETVSRTLSESLHVPRVVALLEKDGAYAPGYATGLPPPPDVVFPAGSPTLGRLRQTHEAQRVFLADPGSWVHREAEPDRARLEALGTQLLLPLMVGDKLLGFLSLGPKRSEEAYSPSDLRLLGSVATQAGLALENSRLAAAVAAEAARRERINRELEIAREVQERFFPQTLPTVDGLDYAGHCRPALGVGGDYYDFLALPSGAFGLAIGDVSGKGIPAALLMATLQASLRGQTLAGTIDLAALMSNVNRLVYDSSPGNRYATFFYAQFDPASRNLTYVNAGHNAPMLFRGGEPRPAMRLEDGGPVIGLLDIAPFRHATVALQPGDLLVAFTDGISEAMNPSDEEWGEERLAAAVAAVRGREASGIVLGLMTAADAFAAGAKQHDDMTIVVVRVLPSRA